jgi:L-asparaginase / beta-aspartyl-peptidase
MRISEPRPEPLLAIHGGAGAIARERLDDGGARAALRAALDAGYGVLAEGGAAVDAVVRAVASLEACGLFNAGKGAVRASDGSVSLDAAVMDGRQRAAGAVAALAGFPGAIEIARRVMEATPHVLLAGPGAEAFAEAQGFGRVPPAFFVAPLPGAALATSDAHREGGGGAEDGPASGSELGTVGAVARDRNGGLAAATTTGGIRGKLPGRVGDSPLVGAGTWADERCAVSATGLGEALIRSVFGFRLASWQAQGMALAEAATRALADAASLGGRSGCVAVSALGEITLMFDTAGMFRGFVDAGGRRRIAIGPDDESD